MRNATLDEVSLLLNAMGMSKFYLSLISVIYEVSYG
jgi:hypothetical protein